MTVAADPLVSIVVPVRNEERYLRHCLLSLIRQDCDPHWYEILVVDGESDDRTPAIIAELAEGNPLVRVLANPGRIVSSGRNVGIRAARGQIIAFVEGHAFVDPDFVPLIVRAFADEHVLCLGRYVEQYLPGDNAVQQATGLLRKSRLGRNPHSLRFGGAPAKLVDPLSVATVYRRELFDRIGLFCEDFSTNEDVELNWRAARAGVQALYLPDLVYSLHPRPTLRGFLRQMMRYGCGKALFVRRHPAALRLSYLAPSLALLGALLGLALPWPYARLGVAPIVGYLGLSLVEAVIAARRFAYRGSALRVALSALVLTGFGIGFAQGLLAFPRRLRRPNADEARGSASVSVAAGRPRSEDMRR